MHTCTCSIDSSVALRLSENRGDDAQADINARAGSCLVQRKGELTASATTAEGMQTMKSSSAGVVLSVL
jgi:hypothetical protein